MEEKTKELLLQALRVSKQAAEEAGRIIMDIYQRDFQVREKADHSPVTEADLKANERILAILKEAFPHMAFLSEESQDDKRRRENPWCFVIDPLDGTKEFIKRTGEFTVNIALVHGGKPWMGLVYAPGKKEMYYGIKGMGAFRETLGEDQDREKPLPIRVSERTKDIRACVSRSHSPENIRDILAEWNIHRLIFAGSALKGCLIASGEAEIYYREGKTCEWDTAAMQCVVEEAGGLLRQLDDTEMTYNRSNVINEKGFYIVNRPENRLKGYKERLSADCL